ncbi:MAG: DUF2460 domain-containing protein [Rickettsiales bacterium]|nr:DUF2460 domain-containing protein [Rickettsiales bacterium]
MVSFHNIRFPADISAKATSKIEFQTEVISFLKGNEKRNSLQQIPIRKFEINFKDISNLQAEKVQWFFIARQGKAYSFRFKDWQDFEAIDQQIGIGDGEKTQFQLIKNYGDEQNYITRKITKIFQNSEKIYLDGVLQSSGYNISNDAGLVSFTHPPAVSVQIKASFQFDNCVRFENDFLEFSQETFGKGSLQKIGFIEVLEG